MEAAIDNPLHPVRHHHHAPAASGVVESGSASADPFAATAIDVAPPAAAAPPLPPLLLLPKPQLPPKPLPAAAAAAAAPLPAPAGRLGLALQPPPPWQGHAHGKVLPTPAALCAFARYPACSALLGALAGALAVFLTFSLYLAPRGGAAAAAGAPPPAAAARCIPTPYSYAEDLARNWSYISDPAVWDVARHGPLMGPLQWSSLREGASGALRFPLCAGGAQSPVDLPTGAAGNGGAPLQLRRRYNSSAFSIGPRDDHPGFGLLPLDANSVWASLPGSGSQEAFALEEFHFHSPSEHTLSGERFALEAHFVHVAEATRAVSVYALLFREDAPAQRPNPFLRAFWPDMFYPQQAPTDRPLNVSALLDDVEPALYSYQGSVTAPPCSPAAWYVAVARTGVNQEQLAALSFRMQLQASNRPLQPLGARAVTRYALGAPVSVPP